MKIFHRRWQPQILSHTLQTVPDETATVTAQRTTSTYASSHNVTPLVNTSADCPVLTERIVRQPCKVMTKWDDPHLRTAKGHLIIPLGRCTGRMEITEHCFTAKFIVLPMTACNDCLQCHSQGGLPRANSAIVDLGDGMILLRSQFLEPKEADDGTMPACPACNGVTLPQN